MLSLKYEVFIGFFALSSGLLLVLPENISIYSQVPLAFRTLLFFLWTPLYVSCNLQRLSAVKRRRVQLCHNINEPRRMASNNFLTTTMLSRVTLKLKNLLIILDDLFAKSPAVSFGPIIKWLNFHFNVWDYSRCHVQRQRNYVRRASHISRALLVFAT